jgi:hypothetical protein
MVGYQGQRISVVEMLDEIIQSGRAPIDAARELRHAIEDGVIMLLMVPDIRERTLIEILTDIEKVGSAYATRLRGERVLSSEVAWQLYLQKVWTSRALFEDVFGIGHPAKSFDAREKARGGAKPKYHWDLIETEFRRLMDYHGDFDVSDPAWDAQARLEEALNEFCQKTWRHEPSASTLRERLPGWLTVWRLSKAGKA